MKDEYLEDLKEIKDIMNRSSRFISLSGLSGISAGILALLGAYLAYTTVFSDVDYMTYSQMVPQKEIMTVLILIALGTLVIAVGTTIYFTTRVTKKTNQTIWDQQTQRLLVNLLIPLVAGGVLCLGLCFKGFIGMAIPLTLIFYGLSLVNASKYTLNEIRILGIIEIGLGLLGFFFIQYGLIFWVIGFGFVHIVYGIIMQRKYKA